MNDEHIDVDVLTIDSIDYANGKTIWILNGAVSDGAKSYPYHIRSETNPFTQELELVGSTPPFDFGKDQKVTCVLTQSHNVLECTWRSNGKSVYVKTSFISGQ